MKNKTRSPRDSGVITSLMANFDEFLFKENELKNFLFLLNAPEDIYGLMRVCTNLIEIKCAMDEYIDSELEFTEFTAIASTARKILNNRETITNNCGHLIGEEHAGDVHPMRGSLHRHAVYAMVWVRPTILLDQISQNDTDIEQHKKSEAVKKFRILQGFIVQLCADLMIDNIEIEKYWSYRNSSAILGEYGNTIAHACTKIRQLANGNKIFNIYDSNLCPNKKCFLNRYANANSSLLDDEFKPIKTLATKIIKQTPRLRDPANRKGSIHAARKRDGDATEYGSSMRIANLPYERVSTREISTYRASDELIDADIPPMEMNNDSVSLSLVSRSCKQRNKNNQILDAIARANHMATSNQRLYYDNTYVTDLEISYWIQRMNNAWESHDANNIQRLAYAFSWISVWTGIEPKTLKKIILSNTINDLPEHFDCAYVIQERIIILHVSVPRITKNKSNKFLADREETSNHAVIRCGEEIVEKMNYLWGSRENSESHNHTPFYRSVKNFKKIHDDLFINVRKKSGYYIALSRMSKIVFNRMIYSGDPVFAMYATAHIDTRYLVSSHYASGTLREINHAYHDVRKQILMNWKERDDDSDIFDLPDNYNGLTTGASIPSFDEVRSLLASIQNKLMTVNEKREYHNWYTLYMAVCIALATGYRAVRNIDLGPKCRVDELFTAYVSDKDDQDNTRTRTVVIAAPLSSQLQEYDSARDFINAGRELYISFGCLDDVGYLFFIEEDGACVEFRPSRAESMMKKIGYNYSFNAARKFLRSQMLRDGQPVDIVDNVLGHANYGREPSNPYNCTMTATLRESVRRYISSMLLSIGFKVEKYRYE